MHGYIVGYRPAWQLDVGSVIASAATSLQCPICRLLYCKKVFRQTKQNLQLQLYICNLCSNLIAHLHTVFPPAVIKCLCFTDRLT